MAEAMAALMQEVGNLRMEKETLKKDKAQMDRDEEPRAPTAASSGRPAAGAASPDEEEEEEEPSWGDILRPVAMEATNTAAQALCQVLSSPPHFDTLRASEKSMPNYQHVPQTPPPRKNRIDNGLCTAQKKLEHAMNMMVHGLEMNDRQFTGVAAAWVRSAWEDLNQQRRYLIAGKQSFKLDHRADDNRPRLLTKEEEQQIAFKRRPKPRAKAF